MKRFFVLFAVVAMAMMTTGCKDEEEATVSDNTYYNALACTVRGAMSTVFNQNIAGTSNTAPDMDIAAPYGGTVHLSGTINKSSDGLTSIDLTYEFDNVKWIWAYSDNSASSEVHLTGTVHEVGTYISSEQYMNVTTSSESLKMTGTVKSGEASRTVDELGKISLVSGWPNYDGEMFGYTVHS